jgi:hypothetical protein
MMELAEDVFDARNDPEQLDVNEEVIKRFQLIHPASVSEYNEGDGPIAWVLLLPTTLVLMNQFLERRSTKKNCFTRHPCTFLTKRFTCVPPWCSMNIAGRALLNAWLWMLLTGSGKDHTITCLFYWSFTEEGDFAAKSLAKACELPLLLRMAQP